jgi:co-chaperonin GroES (HSP10)
MTKHGRTFIFGDSMKVWLLLFFCTLSVTVFAQQKTVDGIVFDKDSKDRIAKVNVVNITSGKSVYNTFKGEFKIDAQPGDVLVFTKYDHFPDTLQIQSNASLAVYMKRTAIQLKEVIIRDTVLNPQKQLAATKNDYTKIYGSLNNHDLLSLSPGSGVGLGIDALYNAFSRSGRNAEKLREIIDRDYKQNVIDFRFNRTYVGNVTHLKDQQLTDFMQRYRPGYYLVTTASEYEFISSIKNNLRRFLRSPKAFTLAPLVTPKAGDLAN